MRGGLARYFAVATVLVVAVFAYGGYRWMQMKTALRVGSVDTTMAPRPGPSGGRIGLAAGGVLVDSAEALSTLPGCLEQREERTGTRAYVLAGVPRAAIEVATGASLVYGDCRLRVERSGVVVRRGADILRVPAPAQLYRTPTHLYLVVAHGAGAQLRAYVPSNR